MVPSLFHLLLISASSQGGDAEPLSTESPDLRSKALILVKIWCLLIVFIAAFAAGVSPYLLKWNEGFVKLGTLFAGGVFFGTALMQFLSDSDQRFENLCSKDYPFAFMLASFGYMLTLFADFIVIYVYQKRKSVGGGNVHIRGGVQPQKNSSEASTSRSQIQIENGRDHYLDASLLAASSFGDCVFLIIGLCFHSVFEGITIGVSGTKTRAWRALWTVTLHKVFAAIAMGISLIQSIPDLSLLSYLAYALAFAISSPIGVAIGIVIDATTPGVISDWIFAISMGLACGVFIYVSVNHLLSDIHLSLGRVSVDTLNRKFLAAILGVGVIALVMIWDT